MRAKELYLKKELTDFDIAVARTFLVNLIGEKRTRSLNLLPLTYFEFEGNKIQLNNDKNNFKYLELGENIYIEGKYFSKIAFMAGNQDIIISLIDDEFNSVGGINITQVLGISHNLESKFNKEKNNQKKEKTYEYHKKDDEKNKSEKKYEFNGYNYIEENNYNYSDNKSTKNKKNKASRYNINRNYTVNNNTFSDDSGNFTEDELKKMWEESHKNDDIELKEKLNKSNYSKEKNDITERKKENIMFLCVIIVAILLLILGRY